MPVCAATSSLMTQAARGECCSSSRQIGASIVSSLRESGISALLFSGAKPLSGWCHQVYTALFKGRWAAVIAYMCCLMGGGGVAMSV